MPYSEEIMNGEWKQEWLEMPEFVQENRAPYRTIYIHFECEEDVKEFSKLIDQNITPNRKYYWYPEREPNSVVDKRYIDES